MSMPSVRFARYLFVACTWMGLGAAAQGTVPPLSRANQAFVARATGDNAVNTL